MPEVLQEILLCYSRLGRERLEIKIAESILAVFHEVLPVEKTDIIAVNLLKKFSFLNIRDAIHAAKALRNNLKFILSVDKHFARISGLQKVHPLELS